MMIFSILSSGIILLIIYLFIRQNSDDLFASIGLVVKIAAGVSLGLIYKFYYDGGDTFQYFSDAGVFANYLLEHPKNGFNAYFETSSVKEIYNQVAYFDQPRALFFAKIISLLYLITGGNYWISGALLSLINFLCTFYLAKELFSWYPDFKKPVAIAFYFLPSFVFWTSGVLKESLAVGALFFLIALILRIIRREKYLYFPYWISMVFAGLMLWELKYFYAAVAFPLLFSLLLYSYINLKRTLSPYFILLFFFLTLIVATQLHYNLSPAHLADVLYQNYQMGLDGSVNKTLEYYSFDGTWFSFLINLPLAFIFGFFRPLIFEASGVFQFLIGLENFAVLILLILGILRLGLRINMKDPMLLVSISFILILDIMLAFSTPNFGTLSRYKVGYWPFFVLLIFLLNEKKVRLIKSD